MIIMFNSYYRFLLCIIPSNSFLYVCHMFIVFYYSSVIIQDVSERESIRRFFMEKVRSCRIKFLRIILRFQENQI